MELFLQLFITGILVGSIYALVAWVGPYLQMLRVLNLAMGELTLIGAYVCLTFYNWGIPFIPALIFTLLVGFILGLLTEHLFLRPMVGEPVLSVIMVTVDFLSSLKGSLNWSGEPVRLFSHPCISMEPSLLERSLSPGLPLGLCCLSRPSPCLRLFL